MCVLIYFIQVVHKYRFDLYSDNEKRFLKCSFSHQFPNIFPACVVTELSVPLLLLPIYFFVSQ